MRKPLEMRGWAVVRERRFLKRNVDNSPILFLTRAEARDAAGFYRKKRRDGRYTVVPVVVRERR